MRFDYPETWTIKDVELLANEPGINEVQFFEPVSEEILSAIDEMILRHRPDFCFRFFGFYHGKCDLSVLRCIPSVRNLTVNCISEATDIQTIGNLTNLENLRVGIYNLTSFAFLETIPGMLKSLSLEATKAKKLSLQCLSRFRELKKLYIEGHHKGIESISDLSGLEEIGLRSVTLESLSFLTSLSALWSFDLKLGGTTNLAALKDLVGLKYLEIWQVRGLSNLSVIADCLGLQYLFLQSLPQVHALPSFAPLKELRRVYLENMKGLRSIAPIVDALALEEFCFASANNFQPDDFDCCLSSRSLKKVNVGFGSAKRNEALERKCEVAGILGGPMGQFEFR